MPVEIKELIIRALVGRDDDEEDVSDEEDAKDEEQINQAQLSQDTIASVSKMLKQQNER